MAIPHALVVPFCAQGHVAPLMELSHHLADQDVLVTFVYTETVHKYVMAALPENFRSNYSGKIRLVTIPDGTVNDEERLNFSKLFPLLLYNTPSFIQELILSTNEKEEHKITFVIVDGTMGFLLDVAKKLNIPRAAFWPASAWNLIMLFKMPTLIDAEVIDLNELESPFLKLINNALPIGPLLSTGNSGRQPSSFWAEDFSCINWLDRQPACSVIYVSLGSTTILSKHQLGELALGLELTGRPFLWVSRPTIMENNAAVYPEGFMDRVARRALVVEWAPQKEVLSHPSVACFLTHCGWNSTMEALFNGVPMLGWPYFADQFLNQTCIVDLWKVGLKLVNDEDGVVGKEEIKKKIEDLMNDEGIRERVGDMKEKGKRAVMEGGASFDNLKGFVHIIKREAGN
ncbi:UDP-glycosyltransferase 83A1-like isoform X2 [Nymphaea colorata]|uniref:UDP-glycosyltransferase 83A1-like isoform X2 n=1 Tax=Nymphaea colorata TaxID=210225 RepID=UPI00129EE4F0|nr:UDP-glycosyltransferase 83A1-like isoform X2 [Nymphaea colorata]